MKICSICGGKNYAKGLCRIHYRMPSQLKTKPISKQTKPINRFSQKMLSELKIYRKLRDEYLILNNVCEFDGCENENVELHHKKTREYHLCDVGVFMSICRHHHNWIHNNDSEARKLGYLLKSI